MRLRTVLPILFVLAGGAPLAQDASSLERGLAAIRADWIRSDVYFFADNAMQGRDTPSSGLRVGARFLSSRLERLGFTPGAHGDWFHRYDLSRRGIAPLESTVIVEGAGSTSSLIHGRDYFVSSSRQMVNLSLRAPVIFCGRGSADELAAVELEGRWALCLAAGESPGLERRVNAKGAVGLVLMADPNAEGDPFGKSFALEGIRAEDQRGTQASRGAPAAPMSVIYLAREGAQQVLSAAPARGDTAPGDWRPVPGADMGVTLFEKRGGSAPEHIENVCAYWPGTDSELADEVILLSAHYDHVGARNGKIWNGADDNASGSMGLLALAEALVHYGPTRRSVMLLWVSGEEKGLWGSQAWTTSPSLPEGTRAICNINIDMIGRNAPDSLLITPSPSFSLYNGLSKLVHELAPEEGFTNLGSADKYWTRSDHANFYRHLAIPVVFLFSDVHEDYHKPTDTPDKLDYGKVQRASSLALRLVDRLQADELAL